MKTSSEWSQIWFDYKTKGQLCRAIQSDARADLVAVMKDAASRSNGCDPAMQIILNELDNIKSITVDAMPNDGAKTRRADNQ